MGDAHRRQEPPSRHKEAALRLVAGLGEGPQGRTARSRWAPGAWWRVTRPLCSQAARFRVGPSCPWSVHVSRLLSPPFLRCVSILGFAVLCGVHFFSAKFRFPLSPSEGNSIYHGTSVENVKQREQTRFLVSFFLCLFVLLILSIGVRVSRDTEPVGGVDVEGDLL